MAERLFNLNNEQPQETRQNQASSSGGNRNHTSNPSRMGGDKPRIEGGETRQPQQGTGVVGKGPHNQNHFNRPPLSCFLCNGNHRVYECPKRASLQAIQAALDVDADAKSDGSPKVPMCTPKEDLGTKRADQKRSHVCGSVRESQVGQEYDGRFRSHPQLHDRD